MLFIWGIQNVFLKQGQDDVQALMRGGLLPPKPFPLVTHRSPECPEGRYSGFDCLIDLLQTVRQRVPAKLGGRGSVSGRGGRGCGERWERGGRELGWGETKVPAPEHEVCRQSLVYGMGGEEGKTKTTRWKGKEKDTISTPQSQEDNTGANPAHEPRQHESTNTLSAHINTNMKKNKDTEIRWRETPSHTRATWAQHLLTHSSQVEGKCEPQCGTGADQTD